MWSELKQCEANGLERAIFARTALEKKKGAFGESKGSQGGSLVWKAKPCVGVQDREHRKGESSKCRLLLSQGQLALAVWTGDAQASGAQRCHVPGAVWL